MTDLYLIAHVVSGSPAFDIASRITCPECLGHACTECDDEGYWWIVPTSGHRAYPYWNAEFDWLMIGDGIGGYFSVTSNVPSAPPSGLPDHYAHKSAPSPTRQSLASTLGIGKTAIASVNITRRKF